MQNAHAHARCARVRTQLCILVDTHVPQLYAVFEVQAATEYMVKVHAFTSVSSAPQRDAAAAYITYQGQVSTHASTLTATYNAKCSAACALQYGDIRTGLS
jgi:hypothetical protein